MESKQASQGDISKHAVQNTFWAYLSFVFGKGLTFIATIILARLLAPEQFGLMGYCLIAIQYLDILNTFGMEVALISRRDKLEEAANAAFVISIGISILLFGLAWISAPAIAAFFQEETVIPLFRTLAIVLLINSLSMVPRAMLKRNLRFKIKLIPDVSHNVAKGVCSVLLAWLGFGVWSLIWGQIAGAIISTITLGWIARWRPTFCFERGVTREMLVFGGHIISVGVAGALWDNVDYLLVGRILGAAALGYYTIAYRIPELVIRNINYVVGNVAHPLLSQMQTDMQRLRSVYFSYIRYISLFAFPAGVGIALIAAPFIRIFYTAKWDPTIIPMQSVALALAISSIGFVPGVIYKAINRPKVLNQTTWVKLPVTIVMLWYAASHWGINGVAFSQIVLALVYVILESFVLSRIIDFKLSMLLKALTPSLVGSMVMAVAMIMASSLASMGLIGLILLVIIGIGSYAGALAFVSRETVAQAYTVVMRAAAARS